MENNFHYTYTRGSVMESYDMKDSDSSAIFIGSKNPLYEDDVRKSCICQGVINICSTCGGEWLFATKYSSERQGSSLWCISDICGSICAFFTWLLIGYPCLVLLFVVFISVDSVLFSVINAPIFYFLALMAGLSHTKSVFTDPGTVPKADATVENINRSLAHGVPVMKCTKCESIKPQRAHHCSICRRCVRKMDHHCPWINNCVGENNQKYFIMFTFYIFLMSTFALYICIHFFIICVKDEWSDFLNQKNVLQMDLFRFSPLTKTILLISVGFESVLFGMFTLIMFFTQICSICYDRTGIETLKNESPKWERNSCMTNLAITFGYSFSWRWFCPINLRRGFNRKYDYELHNV